MRGIVRTGQIITLALAKGILIIGVIVVVIGSGPPADDETTVAMLAIGGGAFVLLLVAAFIIPKMMLSKAIDRFRQFRIVAAMRANPLDRDSHAARDRWEQWNDCQPLPPELARLLLENQHATIVGQVLTEAPAVINLVFFLMNSNPVHLVLAFFLWIGVVAQIPTMNQARDRITRALGP